MQNNNLNTPYLCFNTITSTPAKGSSSMGRNKGMEPSSSYQRLAENSAEARAAAPKGHVPVLVGRGSSAERFYISAKLFNDPCMVTLLEMAAAELGDSREGVLRITCDADHFRRVVSVISKANR